MLDQKHLENVEYFKYSGCMIPNDARCTREIAMAKAAVTSKLGFMVLKLGHCGT
jgi:hypothetical protein